jgi:biofilm protein TabA
MIADLLTNAHLYAGLGPGIACGLRFLAETDLAGLAPGTHELDGRRLFALVSDYTPKPPAEGRWEAHRRYLDLQYVVSGVERMGVAPIERVAAGDYDADRDMLRLAGAGDFLTFGAGQFMILWPGDAHMPGVDAGVPGPVRKVVVKIAIESRVPNSVRP